MTSLDVKRREFMQLVLSAGVTAVGGSMLLRATAARAAAGEVVAAVFPGSWEDAFQNIVAPALKETSDVDLILSPALASDQLGKMMASPGSPPYDALLMSPGQTAIAIENDLIVRVDPHLAADLGAHRLLRRLLVGSRGGHRRPAPTAQPRAGQVGSVSGVPGSFTRSVVCVTVDAIPSMGRERSGCAPRVLLGASVGNTTRPCPRAGSPSAAAATGSQSGANRRSHRRPRGCPPAARRPPGRAGGMCRSISAHCASFRSDA